MNNKLYEEKKKKKERREERELRMNIKKNICSVQMNELKIDWHADIGIK